LLFSFTTTSLLILLLLLPQGKKSHTISSKMFGSKWVNLWLSEVTGSLGKDHLPDGLHRGPECYFHKLFRPSSIFIISVVCGVFGKH
jgi:hypothetical protein